MNGVNAPMMGATIIRSSNVRKAITADASQFESVSLELATKPQWRSNLTGEMERE